MNLSLIFTTVLKHFTEGPPVKSWDLKFHLAVAMIKNNDDIWNLPIELVQNRSYEFKVPSNIIIKEVTLNERYRQKSKLHLEKGLKQYEDVLDDKWKEPNDMITGEWVYIKEDEESRNNEMDKVVFHIHGGAYCIGSAKFARALTSKYAELAKARVFYAGFKPINPKRIVIAGESAGGGLALATLLFLRDTGLPLPGGAILLVDLTHSMPSFWDAELIKADFLPDTFNIRPSSSLADEFIANAKALSDKIAQKNPAIIGHPSFIEMFPFSKSSQISLERCGEFIKRVTSIEDNNTSMIDLLKEDVVSPSISISPSFIGMRVGINGEIRELNETDQNCLKWDKIGIVPKETTRMKKL
ncbi:21285_t:CDS:2 [Gigaspora margarita]|uniref:21285_t:CDS:1 n=1 Tax=Gigaspora margarita TaxID=4874 RepID=A0ABN7VRE0_GIGMA|nr:21285_t:CDS:2 [Gigaspora margarita]